MADIFEKLVKDGGPIGQHMKRAHGYFAFPKLEGELGSRMFFRGKERIVWSLNNYLGLANHPETRKADTLAAEKWGMGYPMGARMMSGNSVYHEELEKVLSGFVQREDAMLLNFGYQGIMSCIDALVNRRDIIVYDAECHACIVDGIRMHLGYSYTFKHNDIEDCEKQLQRAVKMAEKTGGGILLITEGVYGMSGDQGKLKEIVALKEKYEFRILIDDAHGFGAMGPTGAGTDEEQGCQAGIDLYFSTFVKSMGSIGAFIAGPKDVLSYLRYNTRSQIFAKSLPMIIVEGMLKRMEMLKTMPELREKLWKVTNALQSGLRERGFDLGKTNTMVTPVYMKGDVPEATAMVLDLRENYNIFCSIVVYPVIPKGQIIYRLIPTAAHTEEDINLTLKAFTETKAKLDAGAYKVAEIPDMAEAM
ncbi:aminotransferase class I/II-fold pyridoxal phosphate-dependent enzyme [Flavihumibacter sp. RY-1]|uniref:Aminotransferase class I/II-fold pyridoxal phosphate-dependent enzyme n=1 Tax=Flavihumibacter fluminis TaxID=2909236 RepID=A0ABS9BGH4_9BACT|nr:aminotransferase class I/II-fold pyridoxal phosphate-dependent enzyme [Flavihumibacter fluminis]MCF1713949.1 aminotransferase class I/II-fold pyridoxal phosphate-dependent enzyme [Flavihumibacter fluminis]